jgi:hypothetical protein
MSTITWVERVNALRGKLDRDPTLDELLAEAKLHDMTAEEQAEEQAEQRLSYARAMVPTGDPRFD